MLYTLEDRVPRIAEDAWVAPSASVIGTVTLGARASVWFNSVLRGDIDQIVIGEDSNIQDGSVLHTDAGIPLHVGRGSTVGHKVMLHGCEIGDNSLIGIGAVVLNRVRIGDNCIIAAGALVTEGKHFPNGVMIMGAPAKIVREVSPPEIQMLQFMARHYVQNAARFRAQLKPKSSP